MIEVLRQLWQSGLAWLIGNEPLLSALVAIVTLIGVALGIRHFFGRREPSAQAMVEARNVWPKLSEALHRDIEQCLDYAETARQMAENQGQGQPLHIVPPEVDNGNVFTDRHWHTLRQYDPALERRARELVEATLALRKTANERNQMMYREAAGTPQFQSVVDELYQASRRLERAADDLLPLVKYLDDALMGGDSVGGRRISNRQ